NIEEKNGEQFIEIDIKRTDNLNVTISEILEDDTSLDGIDYSLKNNLKPSQLNYYPNPNNGRFNLKFMLDQKGEVTIKVMNILGNEVYKEKLLDFNGTYDNQIDLTGKEKGIYILQIIQKRKALTRKILIE
ncbi:MAG: T9SS type A sorting domain-containing protein, partial [Cyclobacteriaceae bacterium]|nr:T9SS type A sorting domain-containing protein [Cyclobacteriaceae bacterium]